MFFVQQKILSRGCLFIPTKPRSVYQVFSHISNPWSCTVALRADFVENLHVKETLNLGLTKSHILSYWLSYVT